LVECVESLSVLVRVHLGMIQLLLQNETKAGSFLNGHLAFCKVLTNPGFHFFLIKRFVLTDVFPHSIWHVLDCISPLHVVYALWPFLGEEETGVFALLNLTS
jgi:hypothetical protein